MKSDVDEHFALPLAARSFEIAGMLERVVDEVEYNRVLLLCWRMIAMTVMGKGR